MSILTYRMPFKTGLFCANPTCREYADYVLHLTPPDNVNNEYLVCATHFPDATIALHDRIASVEKLHIPGEPNTPRTDLI